jgi:hypothetical protein
MRGDSTPPLATTGPGITATNPTANPNLGRSDTVILFGGNQLGTGTESGARFSVGYWFFDDHALGIEVGGFFLGENRDHFAVSSTGTPIIGIPFNNVLNNPPVSVPGETAQAVAFNLPGPLGQLGGNLDILHKTNFWGAEVNLRTNCLCCCNGYLDFLLGFRELGLDDSLTLSEQLTVIRDRTVTDPTTGAMTTVPAGTTINGQDKFSTTNRFYGVQVGLDGEWQFWDRWSLGARAKVGIGPTQQTVDIQGSRVINVPGAAPMVSYGNLFSQPSNIGRYTRDMFSVVPEVGVTLGYQLTDHIRATAGYNFLYWNNVVRAGGQINRNVNAAFTGNPQPGSATPNQPAFSFNNTDTWAQGASLGLEFRW